MTPLGPKVAVRDSPIHGRGLFATAPIDAGERCSDTGTDWVVMSDEEFRAFTQTAPAYDAIALGNGQHRVSTVARADNPANYGNHSCSPNARVDERGLVALHAIAAGEEITCDYALISSVTWSMECTCGAPDCRGVVRGTVSDATS